MEIRPKEVDYFELSAGKYPFRDWLLSLQDPKVRNRLDVRLRKLLLGHFGNWKALGDGVVELKEDFGPGFRIYLGQDGPILVTLLCGGDKSTQSKDIKLAKAYWTIYKAQKGGKGHA